ncbi:MAG: GNAT family N-acetyltransferase [Pseudomonadota bacterium]
MSDRNKGPPDEPDALAVDDGLSDGGVTKVSLDFQGELNAFASEWPTLDDPKSAICHGFQTADFIRAWVDTIGAACGAEVAFVRVSEAGGLRRPLMFLPFAIETKKGVRILRFIDGDVSDYNGPIVFPWTPDWSAPDCQTLWCRVLEVLPAIDVVALEKMPKTILGTTNPLAALETEPWPVSCHAATLLKDWPTFAEVRTSPPKRYARYQRSLRREYDVVYTASDAMDQEAANAALVSLFKQKARRFAETRVPGFEAGDGKQDFYTAMTLNQASQPHVHLSVLTANDEVLACQWGFVFKDRYYYLICGNETGVWAKYSPGRMINEAMLEWCHEQGLTYADFGIGDEAYKYEYCDEHATLLSHRAALTAKGRLFVSGTQALERLRATSIWQKVRPYKWIVLRALRGERK